MAFTPGGLLLRDAPDILSEDLDWRGGYERVLTAMAEGARRRSRIAGRAQQRIDHTLDRLRRAGYVRVVRSVGSDGSPDPMYETAEVDVLGLAPGGPVLLGECRWQAKPVTERDLAALRRKAAYLPPATSGMTYAFWSRGGMDPALANHPDVRSFTPADILLTSDPG